MTSAWMDDGPSHDDAQDDDEDLRSDPVAQIDIGVSASLTVYDIASPGEKRDRYNKLTLSASHS